MTTSAALIVLFNLKPGQSAAEYEAWAREHDVPTVKGLKSIDDFSVFKANALFGTDEKPPYGYVEIIRIKDLAGFVQDAGGEEVQRVARQFRKFVDKPIFMITEQFAG
jgi:hypothetical protein